MAPAGATGIAEESIIQQIVARDKVSWWHKPNLRSLYLYLVPFCLMIESTSGIDSSLMNSFQALPFFIKYFDTPSKPLIGFVVASYSLGAITAIPFVSLVTDHWGRRWSIVWGSGIMVTGAILQGMAQHIAMFIIARMILGHGIVYAIVSGAALLGELGHPKERHFLGALFNAFYGVGSLLGAGIVCRTFEVQSDWQWRIPGILQALPSLIQIVFAFTIPESPRWLVSRDRSEEALEILIKYHAEGDASNELPHLEMAEIRKALEIENESRKKGWAELFQTPAMRRRTLVVFFIGLFTQFSGNNLISNYLTQILSSIGISDKRTQQRYNVGTEAWGLLCAMIIANITPRYPRRRMYLLCASLLLIIYTGWTIAQERNRTTKSMAAGYTVLVFIYLYKPAYNIAYNALTYVYLVELLPYYVRTKGLSWFQFWGRASSTLGSQVNPIGFEDIGWKYLLVYIFWLAFEIVFIYFLFPETFGKTLEELTFLFESEKEGAAALAATAAKVIQEPHEPHATELEVREDKKA